MPSYTLEEIERGLGRTPAALETFTIDNLIADLARAESGAVFVREAVVEPINPRLILLTPGVKRLPWGAGASGGAGAHERRLRRRVPVGDDAPAHGARRRKKPPTALCVRGRG